MNKQDKLTFKLNNKEKYVVHVRNLKQAINHVLKLEQIDGVIKFSEKYWLKLRAGSNTEFRRNSKDDFQKDSFKLMNNSNYEKF